MTIIISQADVFSDIDTDHPVATIRRMGGGLYRFFAIDGTEPDDEYEGVVDPPDPYGSVRGFSSWDKATNHAGKFVAAVESDPAVTVDKLALRKANSQITELGADLLALQETKAQEARDAYSQIQNLLKRVDSLERQLDAATQTPAETVDPTTTPDK